MSETATLRQFGSGISHDVDVTDVPFHSVVIFGADADVAAGPVTARCGAVLRGETIVRMSTDTSCVQCLRRRT